jgi:hypothetical protein
MRLHLIALLFSAHFAYMQLRHLVIDHFREMYRRFVLSANIAYHNSLRLRISGTPPCSISCLDLQGKKKSPD